MEVRAIAKYVRVQPRKVRIVADEIRGKSALQSAALLRYHPSKGAFMLRKVLLSAIANAQENHNVSPEELRIQTIMVDEGPRLKRMQARAMGRGNRIVKKTSHITVVVEDYEGEPSVKPHGTKAKPRPNFAAPKGKKKQAATAPVEAAAPVATEEEVTDTTAEAAMPEEATPVAENQAPEEGAAAAEAPEAQTDSTESEGPAEEATPVDASDAPEQEGGAAPDEEKGA